MGEEPPDNQKCPICGYVFSPLFGCQTCIDRSAGEPDPVFLDDDNAPPQAHPPAAGDE